MFHVKHFSGYTNKKDFTAIRKKSTPGIPKRPVMAAEKKLRGMK